MVSDLIPSIKQAKEALTRSLMEMASPGGITPQTLHAACDESKEIALALSVEAQELAELLKASAQSLETAAKAAKEDAEAARFAKRTGMPPDFALKAAAKALSSAESTANLIWKETRAIRKHSSTSAASKSASSPDPHPDLILQRSLEATQQENEELRQRLSLLVKSLHMEREKSVLDRMKYWIKLHRFKRCWRCGRWRPMSDFYHTDHLGMRIRYRECSECQIHGCPMMEAPPTLGRRAETPS